MKLSEPQIITLLNRLGIPYQNKSTKGWMPILCPMHDDKHFGSASINLSSGVIHCWICGSIHILKVNKDMDFSDLGNTVSAIPTKKEKVIIKKPSIVDGIYAFTQVPLNPSLYEYTKLREFTKDFCNRFKIRLGLSGLYDGYMIIPIKDKKKNINDFEARKVQGVEILRKFYKSKDSLFDLTSRFKQEYPKLDPYHPHVKYLKQSKVLYSPDSKVKTTLWNIDNLDFNSILYIVEGLGSIPKIYNYITKNVTCTFGSSVTEEQIECLKKFKKIIVLPDFDEAGEKMVEHLHVSLTNTKLKIIETEDTDASYVNDIIRNPSLPLISYISHNFFKELGIKKN